MLCRGKHQSYKITCKNGNVIENIMQVQQVIITLYCMNYIGLPMDIKLLYLKIWKILLG